MATGKTTWYGEGLQTVTVLVNPVASLHIGDLCKAVVTHGKASAGLYNRVSLRDVLNPPDEKGCLEQ